MTTRGATWLPMASLTLAAFLWASAFIAMKVAVASMDPMLVVLGRMFVGSCLFGFVYTRLKKGVNYRPGDWKWLFLMALCEPVLYFAFEAYGLRYTSASQAGMITATLPVMVTLTAMFTLNERVGRRTWFGFFLSIAGVVWLTLAGESTEAAPNPLLGNALELMAMFCATGYMIILKRLSPRYSTWFLTAVQSVVGCVCFIPALFFPWTEYPQAFGWQDAALLLYLGSCVTILAYGSYNFGISRLSASKASAFVNLIPVFAVIMSYLLLDERLTNGQLLACAVVFAGLYFSQSRGKDKSEKKIIGAPT